MIINDNVIKEYLKNVYFICGTPCGGKTTVSRELAKRHGLALYDVDKTFDRHRAVSDPVHQPAMNRRFADADDFFGRTVEEYKQWLLDNTREQLDFVLLDLIRLSRDEKVLCDCHLSPEQAAILTDPSRIAFLIKDPTDVVDDYCNRPDHRDFSDFIHSATDFRKAKATCSAALYSLNAKPYEQIKQGGWFWVERTENSTVADTADAVERHFGLNDAAVISSVEKDSELAEQLIRFVGSFSWEEVRTHVLQLLRGWQFTEWETPFAALVNGRIVGMATFMKTDYYPLTEIFPWVSTVFVDERFRGRRISGRLIEAANAYALSLGFDRTYIPSEHIGLYEKYGYVYLRDIVNYGGGVDRLYVKELK